LIEQCLTSPPTQYRLYRRRFLQVKRPNQQYQSTEGKNKVFSIFLQSVFKYRQNNVYIFCTPLSSYSAKHQQQVHIIAVAASGHSTFVSGVALCLSVCLSRTYDLLKIGMP